MVLFFRCFGSTYFGYVSYFWRARVKYIFVFDIFVGNRGISAGSGRLGFFVSFSERVIV